MFRQTLQLYRNAYSGLTPSIWMQALVLLLNRSGTMVIPFLTVYLTGALHFSIAQAGLMLSVFGLGAVIGVYLGGKLTDTVGFFHVQFWSLFLNGILFFVLCRLRTFEAISVCIFLLAVIGESFRPANAAATAHYSDETNRTRSYSLNRLAINIGFALGPGIGGFLAAIGYSWLFWVDGSTCIIAAIVLWILLKPAPAAEAAQAAETTEAIQTAQAAETAQAGPVSAPPPEEEPAVKMPEAPARSAYKDKDYLVFILFVWVHALVFFQLFSNVPLYYAQVLHMSPSAIGLTLAMNGLIISVTEMVLVYRLEHKRSDRTYIAWGILLFAASFLVLEIRIPFVGVALFSMLLVTVGEMFSMPFMNAYWISRSNLPNRGQYAALYSMAFSAAQVVGPALGAQVAGAWGFQWLWAMVAGLGLIAAWGFSYKVR
jgi:predicted MFS family arabinose efflux permease